MNIYLDIKHKIKIAQNKMLFRFGLIGEDLITSAFCALDLLDRLERVVNV
jgi:hypothetical protein